MSCLGILSSLGILNVTVPSLFLPLTLIYSVHLNEILKGKIYLMSDIQNGRYTSIYGCFVFDRQNGLDNIWAE